MFLIESISASEQKLYDVYEHTVGMIEELEKHEEHGKSAGNSGLLSHIIPMETKKPIHEVSSVVNQFLLLARNSSRRRRRGGLVVSALDFRSRGRWFEPGHCRRVVSLDKKLHSTLSLFTQVYKWVPAIIMLGVTLQWTSIPSRGE